MKYKERANQIQLRPHCKLVSVADRNIIKDVIASKLEKNNKIEGVISDWYVFLKIRKMYNHYWSPELEIRFDEVENGKTQIRGLAGPNTKVWTMFVFFYGIAAILFIAGIILGGSQLMLNITAYWLWAIPCSVLLSFLIWIAAKAGQYRGKEQSSWLQEFLDETISTAENIK